MVKHLRKKTRNLRSKSKKLSVGKRRKTLKRRRTMKKQKGGMCYGSGVGANSYDPNFSIYNTKELQLFPYNPK